MESKLKSLREGVFGMMYGAQKESVFLKETSLLSAAGSCFGSIGVYPELRFPIEMVQFTPTLTLCLLSIIHEKILRPFK